MVEYSRRGDNRDRDRGRKRERDKTRKNLEQHVSKPVKPMKDCVRVSNVQGREKRKLYGWMKRGTCVRTG